MAVACAFPPGNCILIMNIMESHVGRKMVGGSSIGGIKETQEMIDFAAKHKITADVEVIPIDYVNTAMERLSKTDVRYRFVIDIGNTLKSSF
jgi:D-arabinose 1-dehydrogenase-like Zn-dependent alcohol dehydrogenase